MQVDIKIVLVRELVVAVQVLRDPDEDVEEERVGRELEPVVHPGPLRETTVGGVVRGVGHEQPGREGQDERREDGTLQPPQPRRRRPRAEEANAQPLPGRRLGGVGVRAEPPPDERAELLP